MPAKKKKKKTAKRKVSRAAAPRKKRFAFAALKSRSPKLAPGDTGQDVHALQAFLSSMGYLGRDRQPGMLCPCTKDALRHFQKIYGLTDSGTADRKTMELMQTPHCGNPDVTPEAENQTSGPAPFVLRGCKYDTNDLTYAFVNSTPDLSVTRQREIIREAFAAWAAVTPLRFTEVAPTANPTFPISFERLDHGDGSPFDDAGSIRGNTLAHAFFPPPCGGRHSGAFHFDEFETWTDRAAPGRIRLLNVSIHEIGHLLGLSHSNTRDAIMFAFYDDNVDSLRQDDINGIQALYGPRGTGPAPIRGRLARTDDSQLHRIQAQPGPLTVTLRGPAGQDFDLYVRSGLAPNRSTFDGRGFTSTPNEEVRLNVSGGEVFILVDSWRGSGDYEVLVDFG